MEIVTTLDGWFFLLRWLHFLAGITWIGILYYFNFIQTPFFASELGGQARGQMVRGLVPNALWWFRWGAMFTFLTGWTIVLLKMHQARGIAGLESYLTLVVTGGTMGTLMWANVWFVIWPAQKLAIASAERVANGGEADPQAAARAPLAARASRTNTLFLGESLLGDVLVQPRVPGLLAHRVDRDRSRRDQCARPNRTAVAEAARLGQRDDPRGTRADAGPLPGGPANALRDCYFGLAR
jgi:hypothetical protein